MNQPVKLYGLNMVITHSEKRIGRKLGAGERETPVTDRAPVTLYAQGVEQKETGKVDSSHLCYTET